MTALKSRLSVAALVIANLVVALQALRHEWGYYETLLIYWCEALIIGAFCALHTEAIAGDPFGRDRQRIT